MTVARTNLSENVLKEWEKNVPSQQLGDKCRRKNVRLKEAAAFAEERFDQLKKGTDFQNLEIKFHIHKNRAQRILKMGVQKKIFFAPRRTNPQMYYPESRHYGVIEYINKENVLKDTTGIKHSKYPLSSCLEYQKAQSFLDIMVSLQATPLKIHKIVVGMLLDRDSYDIINVNPWKGNLGRLQTERIDNTEVKYVFYKNGRVVFHVVCTNRPFEMETDEDLAILYSFFGQVRDRIESQISDPRGRIVPHVTKWILQQCDFNKDLPITDKAQLTLPDIQLSTAYEIFRLYVKNIEGNANYRCEETVQVNQFLLPYLASAIIAFTKSIAFIKLEN